MSFLKIIPFLFILFATGCEKKICTNKITIENNSADTVMYSLKLTLGVNPDMCKLTYQEKLMPGQSTEDYLTNNCWEDELHYRDFEFYIVHKDSINEGGFYDCDSIYYYNGILRYYSFDESDIDSLKSVDWIIRYP